MSNRDVLVRRSIDEEGVFARGFDTNVMLDNILYSYYNGGIRCHSGQRKLFYSELEYFTKIYEIEGDKLFTDMLVLYVGAAEGHHTKVLIDMFPDLHYLLYDPRKFIVTESENVKIMTGDLGMFTLNSIHFVKEHAKGREIVFICDMRLFVTEEQIWTEMEQQRDWGILLNAKYMLLKYRLPYVTSDTKKQDYTSYNESLIGDKIIVDNSTLCDHPAIYLDGEIFSQIYAPTESTESRLFVKRRSDGKYNMRYYNYHIHENVCAYFNRVYRHLRFRYKDSDDMQNHLLGYDDGYESVCEYYLVDQMLIAFKRPHTHRDIIIELDAINKSLISVTNGNTVISDMLKTMDQSLADPFLSDKTISAIKRLYKVFEYLKDTHKIIDFCNKQVDIIKSSNILSKEAVDSQLSLYTIKKGLLYEFVNGKFVKNSRSFDNMKLLTKKLYDAGNFSV